MDYVVQEGDCISSIAEDHGFFWQTLWNANPELKKLRKNPNVLLPDDIVRIPEKSKRQQDCSTDQHHKFVKKGTPAKFRLIVERFNIPLASKRYILTIDGKIYEGQTDERGFLEVSINPAAHAGHLSMPDDGLECDLELGHLDPLEELIGVQHRLLNLGFYTGPLDGKMNDDLADALAAFQSSANIEGNGELDEATRAKLFDMQDNFHPQQKEETVPAEEAGTAPEEADTPEPDLNEEDDEAEMDRFTSLD